MKRLSSLTTSSADRHYEQMHQLFLHDRLEEAEQEGKLILDQHPKHLNTLFLLAQIAWNGRHYQRARERYHKILTFTPTNTNARLGKARAYFQLYKFEDALAEYLYLYEHSFANVDYLIALADCYQKLNLHKIALRYYQKAVALDPKSIKAHLGLGYEHIIDGHYTQAAEQARIAKELYYTHKYDYDTGLIDTIFDLEKHVTILTGDDEKQNTTKKKKKK